MNYTTILLVIFYFLSFQMKGQLLYPKVKKIGFPIGNDTKLTAEKDGDGWYVARRFGTLNHLGDDWNAESGGNTDCGSPVYSMAAGVVVFSGDIGGGWGNVLIIRHLLPSGKLVESLYAHLENRLKDAGDLVNYRELIGHIGDAAHPCGDMIPYSAHLHFELREEGCRIFGAVGNGYDSDMAGWVDPLLFILGE